MYLYMYEYVFRVVYIYICVYIYTHIYIYIYVYMHPYENVHLYIYMQMSLRITCMHAIVTPKYDTKLFKHHCLFCDGAQIAQVSQWLVALSHAQAQARIYTQIHTRWHTRHRWCRGPRRACCRAPGRSMCFRESVTLVRLVERCVCRVRCDSSIW